MTIDIKYIEDIQRKLAEMARIQKDCEDMLSPSNLPKRVLVESYKEMFKEWKQPENTRVFLFVYLYLFDKRALFGARLRRNTRDTLSRLLNVHSPGIVSVRLRNLLFNFRTFPAFREKVNKLYDLFCKKLAK